MHFKWVNFIVRKLCHTKFVTKGKSISHGNHQQVKIALNSLLKSAWADSYSPSCFLPSPFPIGNIN